MRKRIGKKRLSQYFGNQLRNLMLLRAMQAGDLYNDCSGLNRRLELADAAYETRGHKRGKVLFDLDLKAADGSWCSFKHCGVEPPVSYEHAVRNRDRIVKRHLAEGKDAWARIWSPEFTIVHSDGTFSTDGCAFDLISRRANPLIDPPLPLARD